MTSSGFLVLFGLITLIIPSWFYSDLITTGIFLTLLLIFLTIGILLYFTKLRFSPKIKLTENLIEGTSLNPPKISFKVEIPSFSLFDVFLRLNIDLPYILSSRVRLNPYFEIIQYTISLPHRGEWVLNGVQFELQDKLRLFKANILVQITTSIVARVPDIETRPIPILSSSVTPGDAYPMSTERLGEPFDLRPYQPGDSMKRILWKTFAKSGELITRQPEFSYTPEGEVLIFCAARTQDDYLASLALKYARDVESFGAKILAGCLGSKECFHSSESFELGLISSSFNADEADLILELRDFMGDKSPVALFLGHESDLRNLTGINGVYIFIPSKTIKTTESKSLKRLFFYTDKQIFEEPNTRLAAVCREAGFETTIVE